MVDAPVDNISRSPQHLELQMQAAPDFVGQLSAAACSTTAWLLQVILRSCVRSWTPTTAKHSACRSVCTGFQLAVHLQSLP